MAKATVFHPIEEARDVLRAHRDHARRAPAEVACYAMLVDAPSDFPSSGRAFYEAVRPFGAGTYVSYLSDDEADRTDEAYGTSLD